MMNKELELIDDLLLLDEIDSIDLEDEIQDRQYILTNADLENGIQVQA